MAAEGGANWVTIHGRTKSQGYRPPVFWDAIGNVKRQLDIPIVANGDLWTIDDFLRCQDETGCIHFMIGRGALANPVLSHQIGRALGIPAKSKGLDLSWPHLIDRLVFYFGFYGISHPNLGLMRAKQWMKLASTFGDFPYFDDIKMIGSYEEFMSRLGQLTNRPESAPEPLSAARVIGPANIYLD